MLEDAYSDWNTHKDTLSDERDRYIKRMGVSVNDQPVNSNKTVSSQISNSSHSMSSYLPSIQKDTYSPVNPPSMNSLSMNPPSMNSNNLNNYAYSQQPFMNSNHQLGNYNYGYAPQYLQQPPMYRENFVNHNFKEYMKEQFNDKFSDIDEILIQILLFTLVSLFIIQFVEYISY